MKRVAKVLDIDANRLEAQLDFLVAVVRKL